MKHFGHFPIPPRLKILNFWVWDVFMHSFYYPFLFSLHYAFIYLLSCSLKEKKKLIHTICFIFLLYSRTAYLFLPKFSISLRSLENIFLKTANPNSIINSFSLQIWQILICLELFSVFLPLIKAGRLDNLLIFLKMLTLFSNRTWRHVSNNLQFKTRFISNISRFHSLLT